MILNHSGKSRQKEAHAEGLHSWTQSCRRI